MKDKEVYAHAKQQDLLQAPQKIKTALWGRGSGKSTVIGFVNYLRMYYLPRAKGALVGLTYNQILTKFLPPSIDIWNRMGLKEHISRKEPGHFVVGQVPPKSWPKPYQPPRKYDNVISFFNGFTIEMISMDRKDTSRGGNYDFMDFDEAVLINKERHDKELITSVRGNRHRFNHHLHGSSLYVSSMPWLPSGNWVPDMKELAEAYPDEYYYSEATCLDNIDIVGKEYYNRMEQTLPSLVFQVEVLNKRITKVPNGYYESFNEDIHTYRQRFIYDTGPSGIFTQRPGGWDVTRPLEISFDFNVGFTSALSCQEDDGLFKVLKEFYLTGEAARTEDIDPESGKTIIEKLVDQICEYYSPYQVTKQVIIWGDATGTRRDAGRHLTFFQLVANTFQSNGWDFVIAVKPGTNPFHRLRFLTINKILSEQDEKYPKLRICKEECKGLLISMQFAPLTKDFSKDKSSERELPESEQWKATHLSDCLDYILYPKYHQDVESINTSSSGVILF